MNWQRAGAVLAVVAALIAGMVSADRRHKIDAEPRLRPVPDARLPRTARSVGPLFQAGLALPHVCTAAVVDTPARNVIVTAAHCFKGSGAGVVFAPGYDDGVAPYGTWVVQRVYLPAAWVTRGAPTADYAFAQVAPAPSNSGRLPVQSVVGANTLGFAPPLGKRITLVGYVASLNDEPVICSARTYWTGYFPTIDCPGYAPGTSGSPWLADYNPRSGTGTVTAVIGGLRQGGCSDDTSYSSPFTGQTRTLLARAISGAAPDVGPTVVPSGC